MKKLVALLLALCLLALPLFGCSGALRIGSTAISEEEYTYWISCYKYLYLSRFKELGIEDTPEGWGREYEDGKSYDQVFSEEIQKAISYRIAAAELFYNTNDYTLTEAQQNAVLAKIDGMFYYEEEDADRDALLAPYGTDEAGVRRIAAYEMAYRTLFEKWFGADGSGVMHARYQGQIDAYYQKKCRRLQVMFVSYDSPLAASKMDLQFRNGIQSEEAFLDLAEQYNDKDRVNTAEHPAGLYLLDDVDYTQSTLAAHPELLRLRLEAQMDTCVRTESDDGKGVYYVYRCPLEERAYAEPIYKEAFREFPYFCAWEVYLSLLEETVTEMKKGEAYESLRLADIPTNKEYNIITAK